MNITKNILFTISDYPGGYKTIYNLIYKSKKLKPKEQSIRNTLSRMKKKGLVSNKSGLWSITKEGEELLKQKESSFLYFPHKFNNKKLPKTMIVIFDIPEQKRIYRDWLRSELVGLGFELIQKSVWFGPSLPKEFIQYLESKKLLRFIRFFKVSEKDLI